MLKLRVRGDFLLCGYIYGVVMRVLMLEGARVGFGGGILDPVDSQVSCASVSSPLIELSMSGMLARSLLGGVGACGWF